MPAAVDLRGSLQYRGTMLLNAQSYVRLIFIYLWLTTMHILYWVLKNDLK